MLNTPFMQPVGAAPRAPQSSGESAVETGNSNEPESGFEAEYEQASTESDGKAAIAEIQPEAPGELLVQDEEAQRSVPDAGATEGNIEAPDFVEVGGDRSKLETTPDKSVKSDYDTIATDRNATDGAKAVSRLTDPVTALPTDAKTESPNTVTPDTAEAVQSSKSNGTTAENVVITKSVGAKANNIETGDLPSPQINQKAGQVRTKVTPPPAVVNQSKATRPEIQSGNTNSVIASTDSGKEPKSENFKPRSNDILPQQTAIRANPAKTPRQAAGIAIPTNVTRAELATTKDKLESLLTPLSDFDVAAPVELRNGAHQTGSAQLQQTVARPETPSQIARQMAEALQRMPDRPVEIALSPKELGRVRLRISASEAGVTVSVIAERPETLDLMRRNIEQLSREFEMIGYSDIDFAFAEGEAQQGFASDGKENNETTYSYVDLDAQGTDEHTDAAKIVPATGVDIRL